ncbi:hypothetical protein [Ornithinimicrobium kibberense]|uniref:hypothetical protein n=1 Tax=Ornithinimicrobium kibberense TaxID=282060 RepID=UPI003613F313
MRRQSVSIRRVQVARRGGGGSSVATVGTCSAWSARSRANAPRAAHSCSRAVAKSSAGTGTVSGTGPSPGPRPKRTRWSGEGEVLRPLGDHQVTTWDWARVRAT